MRESYRLSKHPIIRKCSESGKSLDVVFMYVGLQSMPLEKTTRKDVDTAMQKLMAAISNESGD